MRKAKVKLIKVLAWFVRWVSPARANAMLAKVDINVYMADKLIKLLYKGPNEYYNFDLDDQEFRIMEYYLREMKKELELDYDKVIVSRTTHPKLHYLVECLNSRTECPHQLAAYDYMRENFPLVDEILDMQDQEYATRG